VRSAQLPGRHDHDLRAAGEEIVQGIESDGMRQRRRVGINRDASGIVELDGELQLKPDHIIEIDNKSITHVRIGGQWGMRVRCGDLAQARCATQSMDLLPSAPGAIGVAIEDLDWCPRNNALVFDK